MQLHKNLIGYLLFNDRYIDKACQSVMSLLRFYVILFLYLKKKKKKYSLVLRFISYIIMFSYFQMKKIPIKIFISISSTFFCNLNCNMNHRWIISICILLHNHDEKILLLSFSSNLKNFIPRMIYIYNRWIIVYLFIFFPFLTNR